MKKSFIVLTGFLSASMVFSVTEDNRQTTSSHSHHDGDVALSVMSAFTVRQSSPEELAAMRARHEARVQAERDRQARQVYEMAVAQGLIDPTTGAYKSHELVKTKSFENMQAAAALTTQMHNMGL